MQNMNVTNFRKNIFSVFEQTIKYNEPANISTKDGNAVIISEDDYNGLMETLYLMSSPKTRKQIAEGLKAKPDECIPEDEVDW